MEHKCPLGVIPAINPYYDKNSCCGIIFGKKCDEKTKEKLWKPLEYTFPEIFGELDREEKLLINTGSESVVLLENASDIVSKMKDVPGFIEQMFDFIIKDNISISANEAKLGRKTNKGSFDFLGSYTFPLIIKKDFFNTLSVEQKEDTDYREQEDSTYGGKRKKDIQNTKIYDEHIKSISETLNSFKREKGNKRDKRDKRDKKGFILQIALDMEDFGGHYGIAILNTQELVVFDSIQRNGWSKYSAYFLQIAQDVFRIKPTLLAHVCPQPTGGFVTTPTSSPDYLKHLQDMDSQNHFCYLWSIWYFHLYITGGTQKILKTFQELKIEPLVMIKRYIWAILHSFYPDHQKLSALIQETIQLSHPDMKDDLVMATEFITRFFTMHFRYVWDNCGGEQFHLYSIISCDLKQVRSFDNINKCLDYSLEQVPYVLDQFTG